jgi:hypothetical protein
VKRESGKRRLSRKLERGKRPEGHAAGGARRGVVMLCGIVRGRRRLRMRIPCGRHRNVYGSVERGMRYGAHRW